MIRRIANKDIDRKKWDDCVAQSFNGMVYAYSWYLDVVGGTQWEALVEDDYVRIFPFLPKKKWGISYVFQPFATQQLGVFSTEKLSPEKVDEFIDLLLQEYRIVDIHLNVLNRLSPRFGEIEERTTYHLDLIPPYSLLEKSFSTNHKRNIKKAEKNRLSIKQNIDPGKIIQLLKETKGQTSRELQNFDYKLYSSLIRTAIYQRACITYGVLNESRQLIAGAIFLYSHHQLIYAFSASSPEGKEKRAMFFLVNEIIKKNQERHLTLDFEGSNNPDIAFFYRGFGARKISYQRLRVFHYPTFVKRFILIAREIL